MKNVRFGAFALILAGGVAFAVSSLLAQSPAPRPEVRPAPEQRARIMTLDGRGSQIGVMVEDLNAEELKKLSGVTSGVRVRDIDPDSPATKAGLMDGDIVVEFDGERIRSARQFSRMVEETVGGRTVALGVVRDGKRQTLNVTPEARAFGWGIDGDRIGRDIARGLRDLEPRMRELEPRLRELEPRFREMEPLWRDLGPQMREFRWDGGPGFNFDFDGLIPSPRGRLGVQIESLSPQLAEYFGVKDGGVLVSGITKDSPAEKAGLKAGDVITSVNGDRVRDAEDLRTELRDQAGELTIGIVRDKKESTLKATIEEPQSRVRRPARPAF